MLYFYMNPILIAAALIPAIVLAVRVYRSDKYEKEPVSLLLSLLFLGIISTSLALVTEKLGTYLISLYFDQDSAIYNILLYFAVVAISEEGFKFLLLRIRTWNSPAFNCQFDGIVYAVFVSLGFALWENISYVLMYGFGTAMVRAVTAVPGHACFGVFMGVWYGLAKKYENYGKHGKSIVCRWMAFLLPVLMHGCYDFIASIENANYAWLFWVFIAVLFVIAWLLVRKGSKHDQYIS